MKTPIEIEQGINEYFIIYEVETGVICLIGQYSSYQNQRTKAEHDLAFANKEYPEGSFYITEYIQEWLSDKYDDIKRDILYLNYIESIPQEDFLLLWSYDYDKGAGLVRNGKLIPMIKNERHHFVKINQDRFIKKFNEVENYEYWRKPIHELISNYMHLDGYGDYHIKYKWNFYNDGLDGEDDIELCEMICPCCEKELLVESDYNDKIFVKEDYEKYIENKYK